MTEIDLKLIHKKRIERHISLDYMANLLGLSQRGSYLLKEQGKRKFTVDELPILSKALDIPIDKLYK